MKDTLHLRAPGNWINDPNGFIYYKGKYHLFYQYFPYAPQWGTMHWGHAVSSDLVHWEHVGVALFPTRYEDQNGCFSGSALEQDGKLYLYYTGVHYHRQDPENIHLCPDDDFESAQLVITSGDGMTFDNYHDKKAIIPALADPRTGDRTHTRDPKIWRGKDAWYLVLGSNLNRTCGELLFYRSDNLYDWTLVNSCSKEKDLGWMWECPDYFEVGDGTGRQVLMFSAMGILGAEYAKIQRENQSICMPVEFEEETCTMKMSDSHQFIDYGLDLYAPQTTVDKDGRRVVVAWARMPEVADRKSGQKWCGMFCLPRVVEVKKNCRKKEHIYFRVHPEVEKQYSRKIDSPVQAHEAGYRVSLDLQEGEAVDIGGYRIYRKSGRICTDRSAVFCRTGKIWTQFSTPEVKDGFHLDIYVDDHLIEVYVNDGEYVISNVVYYLGTEIHAEFSESGENGKFSSERMGIYTLEKEAESGI